MNYLSKTIIRLLIFSLVVMPFAVQAASGGDSAISAQAAPDGNGTISAQAAPDGNGAISAQAASDDDSTISAQSGGGEKDSAASSNTDLVFGNRAAKTVFKLSQNMPGVLDFPPKEKKNGHESENSPQAATAAPIVIEADRLSYNDATGDILAYGKVVITREGVAIATDQLNANAKTGLVWTETPLSFTHEQANLHANGVFYDYNQKTGKMSEVTGKINHQFITGKSIDILPGHYTATGATVTGCPAKIPDYHVVAEKIEIWPGDKMIIHNAKFLIKNHVIFSIGKYQASLNEKDENERPYPRVGYRNSDGFYIEQHLAYPLSSTTSLFTDINYYYNWNFRPSMGIKDTQRNYTTKIVAGYFADGDNNWVRKLPEFSWEYHPRRIGESAFSYRVGFSYGKWLGEDKTSWHQNYNFYLNHDPICLSRTSFLYLGAGMEHIRESYDKSRQNVPMLDITLTKSFSERLNAWVSYHYKKYDKQPIFNYSVPDISQEINYGFTYKIDRLNTIGITYRYDQEKHTLSDIYYTWYRNLHCWDSVLTYKSKPRTWEWKLNIVHW